MEIARLLYTLPLPVACSIFRLLLTFLLPILSSLATLESRWGSPSGATIMTRYCVLPKSLLAYPLPYLFTQSTKPHISCNSLILAATSCYRLVLRKVQLPPLRNSLVADSYGR